MNPKISDNGFPRRIRTDLQTPAEAAIRNAIVEVEKAGAHPRLTDAVVLLGQARDAVADFVDEQPDDAPAPKDPGLAWEGAGWMDPPAKPQGALPSGEDD